MRVWLALAYSAALIFGGWHIRVWYDGYVEKNEAVKAAKEAAKGSTEIIKFHQQIGTIDDPEKIGDIRLPADVKRLLR